MRFFLILPALITEIVSIAPPIQDCNYINTNTYILEIDDRIDPKNEEKHQCSKQENQVKNICETF
jgi:hypothetical protein